MVCVGTVMCWLQGVDLRQYSKEIERELLEVENASVQDCILEICGLALHRLGCVCVCVCVCVCLCVFVREREREHAHSCI